jgi:hypothetical protein
LLAGVVSVVAALAVDASGVSLLGQPLTPFTLAAAGATASGCGLMFLLAAAFARTAAAAAEALAGLTRNDRA